MSDVRNTLVGIILFTKRDPRASLSLGLTGCHRASKTSGRIWPPNPSCCMRRCGSQAGDGDDDDDNDGDDDDDDNDGDDDDENDDDNDDDNGDDDGDFDDDRHLPFANW